MRIITPFRLKSGLMTLALIGAVGWITGQASDYRSPDPQERLDNLRRFYTARLERDPVDFLAMNALSDIHIEQTRLSGDESGYQKAETLLRRSLSVNSKYNIGAQVRLAAVMLAGHRFEEARLMAESVLESKPRDAAALAVAGDAFFETGRLKEAESYFRDLLDIAPGVASYSRIARLAQTVGKTSVSRQWFEKTREAADEEGGESAAWARVMMADLAIKTGEYERAKELCRQALAIVPDYYLASEHLAEVFEREKDYEAARPLLEKALRVNRAPELLLRMANIEEETGHPAICSALRDEARSLLENRVASGDPGHLRALALYLLESGVEYPRALALAEQDSRIRGGYLVDATLARTFAANGVLDRACVYMNRALAHNPVDPDLFMDAARLFEQVGDREAATAATAMAGRINPRLAIR